MFNALERLVENGYLDKRVTGNELFQNKGARYYLTTESVKLLRSEGVNEKALHIMYNNKSVSESYIDQYTNTFKVYLALRASYAETFHIFTKTELTKYSYMPEPRPDLYLNRIKPSATTNEYILHIYTDKALFIIKKEFAALLEHFDSGDWEASSKTDYPTILLVCADSSMEKKLQHHIYKTLDNAGIDDLQIYLTTMKALKVSDATAAVWSSVYEPGKLTAL